MPNTKMLSSDFVGARVGQEIFHLQRHFFMSVGGVPWFHPSQSQSRSLLSRLRAESGLRNFLGGITVRYVVWPPIRYLNR